MFYRLVVGGILGRNRRRSIYAIHVEVNPGLAEGVHVCHVRRGWIGELDRNSRRIRSKANASAAGRFPKVPHSAGNLVLQSGGESNEFAFVLGEPWETVYI